MATLLMAAALVSQAPATPPGQPDLGWMAGYWLSCENGVEVSETWSTRRGGVMMGYGITFGRQAFSWEQTRIETTADAPEILSFISRPRGAAADTAFRLVRGGPGEVVFENPGHDFPQRIIYRRSGDRLTGRIEGMADRRLQSMEWHYAAAPLNRHCPAPSPNR
jgi:hypothetical protein